MTAALVLLALLAVAQIATQVAATSSSSIEVARTTITSNPKACYKCPGYYDNNQKRYDALLAFANAAEKSKAAVCKPASKCPVVDLTKALAKSKHVIVSPYNELKFVKAGVKAYVGTYIKFKAFSNFNLADAGLTLTNSNLAFQHPNTWFYAARGDFQLLQSVLSGTLRSFSTLKLGATFNKSNVLLTNTIVKADYSTWVLKDTDMTIQWTKRAIAAPGPKFPSAYPVIFKNSLIKVHDGVLKFINVDDAFFVYSTLYAEAAQIVLINSNVRFQDSKLSLKNMVFKLVDSTLQLSFAKLDIDRYLAYVNGGFTPMPVVTHPFTQIDTVKFTAKGSGRFAIKSAAK